MRHRDGSRSPYREALSSGEFRAILSASTVSTIGSVVSAVALTVLVYERTGSPFLSSLTFALGSLPYLFGGTLLSGIVDRVAPRRLLVTLALASMLLTAALAASAVAAATLLVLLSGTSTLTNIANGARGGLVRAIVPAASYVPARSLLRISSQTAQIVGNAIGGTLLVVLTPRGAILVTAGSFLVSACVMRFGLGRRAVDRSVERPALLRDSLQGVRRVFENAQLRRLLLLGWFAPMFAVAPEALAAPYVAGKGVSPSFVGWWLVALPVGMIAGDLVGVWGLGTRRLRRLVGVAAAGSFLPYLAFFSHPALDLALPLLVLAGMLGMYSLGLDAMVRGVAPEQGFGRMMTVNTAGLMTFQGLGFAAAGALAEAVGPAVAIAIAGICGFAAVLLLRPRTREAGATARAIRLSDRSPALLDG